MPHDVWIDRWRAGRTGFHRPAPHPELVRRWPALHLPPLARVLVPLCGKSLDLKWLRDSGHPVIGVDSSAMALESFCAEQGVAARRGRRGAFDVLDSPGLELLCGDWFDLTAAEVGSVDAVYDRAALDACCGDAYAIEELGRREVLAEEPRMRERGLTRLQEAAYRLTRR